jgi:hypothetical protein
MSTKRKRVHTIRIRSVESSLLDNTINTLACASCSLFREIYQAITASTWPSQKVALTHLANPGHIGLSRLSKNARMSDPASTRDFEFCVRRGAWMFAAIE